MFKKIVIFLYLIISYQVFSQQNLVLNPSFENVNGKLKCYLYGIDDFVVSNWESASEGSIDVFSLNLDSNCVMYPLNDSFADQKPRTGKNYLGFTSIYNDEKEYREYLRGNLSEVLEVGALYKIEFYVCLSSFATAASNNIGLTFINSKTPIFPNVDLIPLVPDVNYSGKPITEDDKWTLLTFDFIATKPNLDAFIIGNFYNSADTNYKILSDRVPIESYMLIDDVSISRVNVDFDIPKEICAGESISFPLKSTSGIVGTWAPEFNPYQSETYTFTSKIGEEILELNFDVLVRKNYTFELSHYCSNYQYFVKAKFQEEELPKINSFKWELNNTRIINNNLKLNVSDYSNLLKDNNILKLTLTDENGCENFQTIEVSGKSLCKIQKEVTPNNDGINDFLDLESFGGVNLKIFNRFGNIVYENESYKTEWNGQQNENGKLPVGEYYYQLETSAEEILNGWINLIY